METFQQHFVQWLIENKVLLTGEFTLKSGKKSKYFLNTGNINAGGALAYLTQRYFERIRAFLKDIKSDVVVFGAAYKGIPLCVSLSVYLDINNKYRKSYYCFDRKEKKSHGDKGEFVGKDMKGMPVIIIDDILTSGKSIFEAHEFVTSHGGEPIGVCVAVDRMEPAKETPPGCNEVRYNNLIDIIEPSATCRDAVTKYLKVPVHSIITIKEIAQVFLDSGNLTTVANEMLENIEGWRK